MPTDMSAAVAAAMPQSAPEMYSGGAGTAASGGVESEEELLRRRSTPAVRRLAEEHNVDLRQVTGTGLGGRVSKEDILQYVAQRGAAPAAPAPAPVAPAPAPYTGPAPAPAAPAPVAPAPAPSAETMPMLAGGTGDTAIGLTPMRRAIARHMVDSVHTSPHAWTTVEIDMTNVVKYRESIKADFERREGLPITYLPFFIKAVVDAIKQVPQVNATWNDEQGTILKREINVGIPIDIAEGLIVPVIHGADNLSVTGIARKVFELAEKARAGKLTLPEIQGGTITVNNTGALGTIMTHSIINQPQACEVDGTDPLAMYEVMKTAADRARKGDGPTLVEAKTYRLTAHSSDDNDRTYRGREEVEAWRAKEPLPKFRQYILDHGIITEEELAEMKKKVDAEVNDATDWAETMPDPVADDATLHVYASAEERASWR